jgi:hypothetical protein
VYYPADTSNKYAVLYFVPGLFGTVPPRLYDDLLAAISAHGYVTLSPWPLANGEGATDFNFTAEAHLANLDYVSAQMFQRLNYPIAFPLVGWCISSAQSWPRTPLYHAYITHCSSAR